MITRSPITLTTTAQFRNRRTVRDLAPVQAVTESWVSWIVRNAKDLYVFQATYGIALGAALPFVNLMVG